jgi:hypothetical protein
MVVAILVGFPLSAGIGRRRCRHWKFIVSRKFSKPGVSEALKIHKIQKGRSYLFGKERIEGSRRSEEGQEAWPPSCS